MHNNTEVHIINYKIVCFIIKSNLDKIIFIFLNNGEHLQAKCN